MAEFTCVECFRTFLRVILVAVNIFISFLGLLVFAVGVWAVVKGDTYFEVSSNEGAVVQVPILLIVVGIFVLLLGVVGTVGGIFAGTIGGRIILGLYGFVLALLVVCEIAGGIAAAVEKNDLSQGFTDSVNDSFHKYYSDKSIKDSWNNIQKTLSCCGNNNYTDYFTIFQNNTIPETCCNKHGNEVCSNLTNTDTNYIFSSGCGSKVRSFFNHSLGVVAGVAISFGFLQIIGVVVSCFVAIAGRQVEGKYQVV